MPHLTADLPCGWQGEKRTPLGPGDLAVLFREAPYELSFQELGLQVLMDGKPLKSERITGSLRITIHPGVLIETMVAICADVRWATCNIYSTQDQAAASTAAQVNSVFAIKC